MESSEPRDRRGGFPSYCGGSGIWHLGVPALAQEQLPSPLASQPPIFKQTPLFQCCLSSNSSFPKSVGSPLSRHSGSGVLVTLLSWE